MLTISKRKGIMASVLGFAAAAIMAGAGLGEGAKPAHKAKVGEKAPSFTLTDINGKEHTLASLRGEDKIVVLEWFNAECPFVVRHYSEQFDTMNKLAEEYKNDVVWVRINSNADGEQGAGLETNKKYAKEYRIKGPILLDPKGEVGHTYGAQTTPHMYVIDKEGVLRYQGGIDNDPRGRDDNRVNYVEQALKQILAGETVTQSESRPYGCTVKYASKG